MTERNLPSNHDVVTQDGTVTFHFFVDSAEGVAVDFDATQVLKLADAAEWRLAQEGAAVQPSVDLEPPVRGVTP
jgi:hypothetical protein